MISVKYLVNGNMSAQKSKDCILSPNGKQTFNIFGSLCFNGIRSYMRKKVIEYALEFYFFFDFNNNYMFIIQ